MKKKAFKILGISILCMLILTVTAFAITDADVQSAVNGASKEKVSGNLFVWFLCAIAFLKISQKIDSFMSALGISVGRTGGSMMAEAVIAARGIGTAMRMSGKFAGFGKGGASAGNSPPAGSGTFGGVGKKFTEGAVGAAVGNKSSGVMSAIGKKMYGTSIASGGSFANEVISSIAHGERTQMGSITGANAKTAMESYFGYNADKTNTVRGGTDNSNRTSISSDTNISGNVGGTIGSVPDFSGGGAPDMRETVISQSSIPQFSDVEIGGGRITGSEITDLHPDGIQFAMYDAEKYEKPTGEFETASAVDGSKWYKQYAVPTVEKSPYMGTEGKIKYNEKIVSKLPKAPPRKDKV